VERILRYTWALAALGLASLLLFLVMRFGLGLYTPLSTGAGVAAGLLLAAWGLLDRDTTSSRAFQGGAGSSLLLLLAAALAAGGYHLARKHEQRWDLTRDGAFTLADSTRQIVTSLTDDVQVYAFFGAGSTGQSAFKERIRAMAALSDHLSVQWIDPLQEPLLAQRYTITTENGTVVFALGERTQRLEARFDEASIADALVRLTSGQDHQVCWAVGHDEVDPDDDTTGEGYGAAVVKFEGRNAKVVKLVVPTQGVPSLCEALVIARPRLDWAPYELEALAGYVSAGGRVLTLLDVGDDSPGLAEDLERYGLLVGRDVVWDPSPGAHLLDLDPSVLLLTEDSYNNHPITAPLHAIAALGISRSVQALRDAPAGKVTELIHSTDASWADTNLAVAPEYDAEADLRGPVPVAAAVVIKDPEALKVALPNPDATSAEDDVGRAVPANLSPKAGGRLVVFGDADFASNRYIATGNNQDLFLNSLAWLLEEDAQLAQRPDADEARLEVSPLDEALLWVVTVFLVPLGALLAAAVVLVRRRYL